MTTQNVQDQKRTPRMRCFSSWFVTAALLLAVCAAMPAIAQENWHPLHDTPGRYNGRQHFQGLDVKTVPPEFFGITFNKAGNAWPLKEPITYGMIRVWDSGAQWSNIQSQPSSDYTDATAFNWTPLQTLLGNAYKNGVTTAVYTMSRTPQFALAMSGDCTSNPKQPACDARCNYYGTGKQFVGAGSPGQCYPPADLNPDGTGTDQTWKNWVTALANEAVSLCKSNNAACIKYYEVWNEIDRNNQGYPFPGSSYAAPYMFGSSAPSNSGNAYYGSFAQIVRMTQDARCIILGRQSLRSKRGVPFAIDNENGPGVPGSCIQERGIEPDAQIVAPSSHPVAQEGLNVISNIFYCDVPGTTTGAPNWCNTGDDGAQAFDVMNWHMKPGNEADGFNEEVEMEKQYCAVEGGCNGATGILRREEQHKPFFNDEAGYRGASAGWSSPGVNLTGNPDMQASFIARYALTQWSLGISNFDWYDYDLDSVLIGNGVNGSGPQAGDPALAWSTVANWMVGRSMSIFGKKTQCSITPGTTTQWTCFLSGPHHFIGKVIWDIGNYGCNADSYQGDDCTTYAYFPSSHWHAYRDLWGHEYAISPGGSVQIGNLPILLEDSSSNEGRR